MLKEGRVCISDVGYEVDYFVNPDPAKTLLNRHLNSSHNMNLDCIEHDETDLEVTLLKSTHHNDPHTHWLCWKKNGSIYLEDENLEPVQGVRKIR